MCTTHLKITRHQLVAQICFSARSVVPVLVIDFLSSPAVQSRVSLCYSFSYRSLFCFSKEACLFPQMSTGGESKILKYWSNISCIMISVAVQSKWPSIINSLVLTFTSFIISSYCGSRGCNVYFQRNFHCDLSINYQTITLYWSVMQSLKPSLLPLEQML